MFSLALFKQIFVWGISARNVCDVTRLGSFVRGKQQEINRILCAEIQGKTHNTIVESKERGGEMKDQRCRTYSSFENFVVPCSQLTTKCTESATTEDNEMFLLPSQFFFPFVWSIFVSSVFVCLGRTYTACTRGTIRFIPFSFPSLIQCYSSRLFPRPLLPSATMDGCIEIELDGMTMLIASNTVLYPQRWSIRNFCCDYLLVPSNHFLQVDGYYYAYPIIDHYECLIEFRRIGRVWQSH